MVLHISGLAYSSISSERNRSLSTRKHYWQGIYATACNKRGLPLLTCGMCRGWAMRVPWNDRAHASLALRRVVLDAASNRERGRCAGV